MIDWLVLVMSKTCTYTESMWFLLSYLLQVGSGSYQFIKSFQQLLRFLKTKQLQIMVFNPALHILMLIRKALNMYQKNMETPPKCILQEDNLQHARSNELS